MPSEVFGSPVKARSSRRSEKGKTKHICGGTQVVEGASLENWETGDRAWVRIPPLAPFFIESCIKPASYAASSVADKFSK